MGENSKPLILHLHELCFFHRAKLFSAFISLLEGGSGNSCDGDPIHKLRIVKDLSISLCFLYGKINHTTLPETINFRGKLALSFREGILILKIHPSLEKVHLLWDDF